MQGRREAGGTWSASSAAGSKVLLCNGRPWGQFEFHQASGWITVRGFDPRLSVLGMVIRAQGIDLEDTSDMNVERDSLADTLKASP